MELKDMLARLEAMQTSLEQFIETSDKYLASIPGPAHALQGHITLSALLHDASQMLIDVKRARFQLE